MMPLGGAFHLGAGSSSLGELQTISNFSAGQFPLSAAIAIDRSFSVAGTRLSLAKTAAQATGTW